MFIFKIAPHRDFDLRQSGPKFRATVLGEAKRYFVQLPETQIYNVYNVNVFFSLVLKVLAILWDHKNRQSDCAGILESGFPLSLACKTRWSDVASVWCGCM